MARCKKCFLSDTNPNIKLNNKGICNLCNKNSNLKYINNNLYIARFKDYIEKIRQKNEYDCVLLFSGGKDSSYLLKLLKNIYKLNVLTITFDNGLFTDITKKNIKNMINLYDVDNITVKFNKSFIRKLYKYFILNAKNSYCTTVCGVCHLLIASIGLKEASKRNVPLLLSGFTRYQNKPFEISRRILLKSWIPNELYYYPFKDIERNHFWNPNSSDFIPRYLNPLIAIGPYREGKIIKNLEKKGLNCKRTFSPVNTNCKIMWLLIYLDLIKKNFNPYMYAVSRMIRDSYVNKLEWFFKVRIGTSLLKHNILKRKEISESLKLVELNIRDI
jgi:3'-phosphoadenosine 5'-phosphosulfate sulfotransferase (PAPS reductase)/FAD synthetase